MTRASLHNLEILDKLGLSEGCRVELSRRGEVIPQLERVVEAGGAPIALPAACPSCGGPVERPAKEGDAAPGRFLYCVDPDTCPAAVVGSLEHFVKILDVEGFGSRLLQALVTTGTLRHPWEFFELDEATLLGLREAEVEGEKVRIGEKLAAKLVASVRARRRVPLATFLAALGIEDLGGVGAERLVDNLKTLPAIRAASVEALQAIEGFGEERARSVVEGLRRLGPRVDALLAELELDEAPAPVVSGHPLGGKSVVFTGTLATMDRKTAQQKVRAVGGRTPSSVTQDLDFLVIGDKGSPLLGEGAMSTKHKTAERLIGKGAGIQVIAESAFLALLGDEVAS